ncbi:hypothetical protein NL676_023975 [Syzygium grande]|nr:hypothetical protein NL676_023975 [Syzygium grande]
MAPRPWPLQVFKSSFRDHETLGLTAITASSAPPAAGEDKPLPSRARTAMASPDLGEAQPRLVKRRLDGHGPSSSGSASGSAKSDSGRCPPAPPRIRLFNGF